MISHPALNDHRPLHFPIQVKGLAGGRLQTLHDGATHLMRLRHSTLGYWLASTSLAHAATSYGHVRMATEALAEALAQEGSLVASEHWS